MKTATITLIHPNTHKPVEVSAPVSKIRLPLDIFFNGDDVLFVRFIGANKRRAVLSKNELNQWVTVKNSKTWILAAVALVTDKTLVHIMEREQINRAIEKRSIDVNEWNYTSFKNKTAA